jgi:cellulose synthase/poly-beta-1,6-N-acetylglucosamine synthase-like glycosyltransferase
VLIIPSSWGFPTGLMRHQNFFWRRCRGERRFLQGESLTSNLFTLLLFCLVSLLHFVFFLFIKNTKKLVPTIVVIFVGLLLSCFIMLSING